MSGLQRTRKSAVSLTGVGRMDWWRSKESRPLTLEDIRRTRRIRPTVRPPFVGCGPISPQTVERIKRGEILCPFCSTDHTSPRPEAESESNRAREKDEPTGYIWWHMLANKKSKTHYQVKCKACGFYHGWKRKARKP